MKNDYEKLKNQKIEKIFQRTSQKNTINQWEQAGCMQKKKEWFLQVSASFQDHVLYQYTNVFPEYLLEFWYTS